MRSVDAPVPAVTPSEIAEIPGTGAGDTIIHNRVCPVLEAAQIPKPPAEYRVTPAVAKRRFLRKVDEDHAPLLQNGLAVCAARGAKMEAELGQLAPRPERAAQLNGRLSRARALKTAVLFLLRYADEIEDIALHDAILYLEEVRGFYDTVVKRDPGLAEIYEPMVRLFEARSAKISEGQARAKALREAKAEKQKK
jgi:hypothetical protein